MGVPLMNSPLSSLLNRENSLFKETKKLIQKVYLADDRPWVVGYSGGKALNHSSTVGF